MLSLNGGTAIVTYPLDSRILVMDIANGKERTIDDPHRRWGDPVALSSSGKTLITVSSQKPKVAGYWFLQIWDTYSSVRSRTKLRKVTVCANELELIAVSSDGGVAVLDDEGLVQMLNAGQDEFGPLLERVPDTDPFNNAMAFSTNSEVLAVSWSGMIQLWNTQSRSKILSIVDGLTDWYSMRKLAFSPSGGAIASSSRTEIRIWSTNSGRLEHSITVQASPTALSFSSEGKYVITEQGAHPIPGLAEGSSNHILISGNWISGGGKDLVFIPTCALDKFVCMSGHRVYFLTRRDKTTYLELRPAPKSMIEKG